MLGKHGWHCECLVCKTGKGLGVYRVCTHCDHPSHKKVSGKKRKK